MRDFLLDLGYTKTMAEVKVLIEGYAKEIEGGWLASSTVTLIRESGLNIIADPGVNRTLLLERLEKEGLAPEDIDIVFMTHYHPDHNLLAGIFSNAKVADEELVYENDKQTEHDGKIPGTAIEIISTPGHDQFHGSLLVDTNEGKVAVAGDVFWWADTETQDTSREALLAHKDPFVKDAAALASSRKKLLELADWIIPGHGKKFKVN